jgi:hypothetical protein
VLGTFSLPHSLHRDYKQIAAVACIQVAAVGGGILRTGHRFSNASAVLSFRSRLFYNVGSKRVILQQ